MSYNGWSNYETWCVSLWLSNEEGLYNDTRQIAQDYAEQYDPEDVELAVRSLGGALRDYCESFPEVEAVQSQASFVSDLFGCAWGEVDWQEIAANLISEFAYEDAAEYMAGR